MNFFVSVPRNLLMNNIIFSSGAYQPSSNSQHCIPCEPGTYSELESTSCTNCPPGQVASYAISIMHIRVPPEKHPAMINPTVNRVTQDSSPAQEHLVSIALLESSLQSLEQLHAVHVLLVTTLKLIVAWLVLLELFP